MFDPTDIRPGQLTLRVEAVAGLQPIWVMAMGPDAEEFARLAVEALRGENAGTLYDVSRVEGRPEGHPNGDVPGWEIDLREATGLPEVERRLAESVGVRGVHAGTGVAFNEYAAWGDRRLATEIRRTEVGMAKEWDHHREHSAKGLARMQAEKRAREGERAAYEADATPAPGR